MPENKARSTDARDYQNLPQAIGVMAKHFADGHIIPTHEHERDQLLYATRGIMQLRTAEAAWIVPRDSAVCIPAGTPHSVSMHGNVDMRTLYIASHSRLRRPAPALRVFSVSRLLRELILALSEEPVVYGPDSRAGIIARLIELEIDQVQDLPLSVPLPSDARLQRLCAALLADPSDRRTLTQWSEIAGASPRTLARLFERELGLSFNQWRHRIRLHNALPALVRGEPIARVARQCGYQSASAFSAAFGREMGAPPSRIQIDG